MSNDTSNTILKAIETMVKNEVNQLQADITEKGIIKKIANKSERKYEATYQGVSIYLYAKEGEQYNQGDEVYFVVPKGDLSNKKIIQGLVNAEPAAPFYTNGPTWDIIYGSDWGSKIYGLTMQKDRTSIPNNNGSNSAADGNLEIWGIGAKTFSIQASFWTKLYDIPDLDIEDELQGEFGIRVILNSDYNNEGKRIEGTGLIYELKPQTLLDQIPLTGQKKTLMQTFELPSLQGAFHKLDLIEFYQLDMKPDLDTRATSSWNLLVSDIKIGYDSLETDELFQATLREETDRLVVDLLDRSTSKSFFENIDYCNQNVRVHFYKEHLNAKSSILLGRGWKLEQRTDFAKEEESGGRNIEKRKYYILPNFNDNENPRKDYENYKAVVVVHLTKEMKKIIASNAGLSINDLKDALTFVTNNYMRLNEDESIITKNDIGQVKLVINSANKKHLYLKLYNENLEEEGNANIIYSVFSENDQIIKTFFSRTLGAVPITELNTKYKNYTVRVQRCGDGGSAEEIEGHACKGFWEWNSRTGSKMMQVDKTIIEEG